MLKNIVKFSYKNKVGTDIIDIFADYFKYEIGVELLLNLRMVLYIIVSFIVSICFYINDKEFACWVTVGATILFQLYNLRDVYKHMFYGTPRFIWRSRQISNWILGHHILTKQFLSKEEWNIVIKTNGLLYSRLVSGYSGGLCYTCALELALQIDNAYLVYAGIGVPDDKKEKHYAHAFVIRNGEVFDTNFRRSFNEEDYYKLFDVKVYHKWNYDEYSEINFKKKVSKDFHNWCEENQIRSYQYF